MIPVLFLSGGVYSCGITGISSAVEITSGLKGMGLLVGGGMKAGILGE